MNVRDYLETKPSGGIILWSMVKYLEPSSNDVEKMRERN